LNIYAKKIKKLSLFITSMFLDGYHRASFYKRINYFNAQGDNCYFAIYNFGTEPFLISFGNNCVIATGVRFINHDMSIEMINFSQGFDRKVQVIEKEIKLGDNVFIGADSIILPGVTIGSNCIVGAGSVVTKNIPDGEIWAGVPAKKISIYKDYIKRFGYE